MELPQTQRLVLVTQPGCETEQMGIQPYLHSMAISGLPPGNDKTGGTLSTAENFVPQKKINLKKQGFFKAAEFQTGSD